MKKEKDGEFRLLTLSNVDSDHLHHLDDVARPLICQVVVVVTVHGTQGEQHQLSILILFSYKTQEGHVIQTVTMSSSRW